LRSFLSHLRGTSISQRLILSMVLVVIVTVAFGGLPAVVAIWLQLEQQLWLRVQDAQAATQDFYDAERVRLADLAALVAEHPTLCALMQRRDTQALTAYLDNLRQDTNVDALLLITFDGQSLGDALTDLPSPDTLLAGRKLPFADFIALDNPPRVLVVAADEIQLTKECGAEVIGRLLVARELRDDFMQTLARYTGLAQSLVVGERRVATSPGNLPDWPLDLDATVRVVRTRTACCTFGTAEGEEYYLGLAPLIDGQGRVVAVSEVALPGGAIRRGALYTIVLLFGIGLAVALGGSTLAIVLTRRITRPLLSLAEAAERMDAGDLESPIGSDSGQSEIDQLASQLDRARRHLRQTLQVTQREMKHIERLLGAIHEGVIALDETGRVTFFSPDAERILGYRAPDVLQAHYTQVFRPAPGEAVTLREVLQPSKGEPPAQRLTILDAHDRPITLAVSTSWLNGDEMPDRQRERVLVLRDVSEEEAVNRLRCNFLANVAHEFRTPLSGVTATTELLVEEGSNLTSDELAELANTIRLSTLHLQALVDNLLESASIEADCFRLRPRPIHLQDVIHSAVEMMMPLLKRRNQSLEVDTPDELPTLWADPDRLIQVLVNLLANASKFGPMSVPIALSVKREHDSLTFAVQDSGPGLPAERFADLFNRFVTGDQPPGAQYGIGLGLSVVKAIVEAHGGQVGAQNRTGGGAQVWFTLPLTQQGE
jgi:signal transduction histidine kinase